MGRWATPLLMALVAVLVSGCAVGVPRPVTYLSDLGATVNADIYSSVEGDTTYQVFYGPTTEYGSQSAPLTVQITNDAPHPVSIPLGGLTPNSSYHWQVCAHDQEEDPPREVCSEDQVFTTGPPGGRNAIAFTSDRDGNYEIYVMNTDGTNPVRLTNNPAQDTAPSWSPDGRRIAFTSNRDGNSEIYLMDSDGGNPTRLTNNSVSDSQPAWSPAGDKIMFTRASSPGYPGSVVFVINANASGEQAVPPAGEDWRSSYPFWAPDAVGYGYLFSYPTGTFPPVESGTVALDSGGGGALTCGAADWHPFGRRVVTGCLIDGGGSYLIPTDTVDDIRQSRSGDNLGPGEDPSWSPHGLRIAFVANGDIWTMAANGTNRVNRTNTAAHEADPDWSHRP